jgi:FMN phosphatase YigB (HAD superfamily)
MTIKRKLLRGIKVISFDSGFTLIKTEPRVGEVYAGIAARFGFHLNPEDDVFGAQKAGIQAVCIDRRGKYPSLSGEVPVISSLSELLD